MEKISWTDHVRNEEVLLRVKEQRNILHEISKRKAKWIDHILHRNCLLQRGFEGNTGCFKKSFTTLKAYRNLYRGHTQRFERSKCSKTHRVLPRIVMVQCDFHW